MGRGPLTDEVLDAAVKVLHGTHFFAQDERTLRYGVYSLDGWGDGVREYDAPTREEVAEWLRTRADAAHREAEQKMLDSLLKLREIEAVHQRLMRLLG